jgi:glycosyltransferase involved in cell wall biosynthesis
MRIAIVTATFPPYHGGMGAVAAMHAAAFTELGHEVTVFTSGSAHAHRHDASLPYQVRRLPGLARLGNAVFLPSLAFALRGFETIILHYPAFGLVEPVLFWRYAFGSRARFFVYYHMDPISSGVRGMIFKFFERTTTPLLLRAADRIILSSLDYALAGYLGRAPEMIKRKFVELPLAVDTERCHPPATPKKEGREILFVGAMDRAHDFKGVPELLAAFAAAGIPTATLTLVGGGELLPD